ADDAVRLQPGPVLRGLDDRRQFLVVGFAAYRAGKQLAIFAAHLVVEIAGYEMQYLRELRIGLAWPEEKLGIDDNVVLGAGVQRLEFDAQRPVLGIVGVPRLEPAARVGRKRQYLQRLDAVERLFREIVVA